ncbi:MAG: hypothetical protein RLZZ350_506 [Verrucomicrobiota bacterium]|jgi:hypothetical protein
MSVPSPKFKCRSKNLTAGFAASARSGSVGTTDNSPAFQRRDEAAHHRVPQGRLTNRAKVSAVPTELIAHHRFPGVETPGYCRSSLRDKKNSARHGGAIWSATFLLVALILFAGGCATRNHFVARKVLPDDGRTQAAFARAELTLQNLFPPTYRATQRAIVTAVGKQFTCDGLLQVAPTNGWHLALVSSFGVVTDLRVTADGGCELLKVTPLFREDWSRHFVARDLRWLFVSPRGLQPVGRLADGRVVLQTAAEDVTARYIFSADGSRWEELDLLRGGKVFYHAAPRTFRKFAGFAAEIPAAFAVEAEAYRIELRLTEVQP